MPTYTELLPKTKSEKHGALVWEPAIDNATSTVAGVLTLTGMRSHCRYKVSEFPADMTGRAFMLEKLGTGAMPPRNGMRACSGRTGRGCATARGSRPRALVNTWSRSANCFEPKSCDRIGTPPG